MKKTLILSLILLAFSLPAAADTIIFKDGMRVEAQKVWVEDQEVRCEIGGIIFGYPKADVKRIVKGRSEARIKKADATVIKVHKEVTAAPQKETATPLKKTAGPDKRPELPKQKKVAPKKKAIASKKDAQTPKNGAVLPKKEVIIPEKKGSVSKKPKAVPKKAAAAPMIKKAVPAKKMPAVKKGKSSKTASPQYAAIPSFKEIINEDDNNPPAYVKRRRVLLVARGLAKARIKALLLSYEKKLRNELNAQKARYKLIEVWAYDDFERADEGAAGWIGKISNGQKTGELSEDPVLSIR